MRPVWPVESSVRARLRKKGLRLCVNAARFGHSAARFRVGQRALLPFVQRIDDATIDKLARIVSGVCGSA